MARNFNGKKVELLAPAGNFEIFKELLPLPCDAFYFGGKLLNMRLHRKDFNFTNDELAQAVKMAHCEGKSAYITVNNLHDKEDLENLEPYLEFIANDVKPDALIVQDFSTLALCTKLGLNIHASVMMNVHSRETVQRLLQLGVSRVVVSRDVPLAQVKILSGVTDMEFEYFVHGDMCIAHSGQCLYSQMLFGCSGNRGVCLKPCRWDFDIEANGKRYGTSFPMSARDMCMYEYIPELIDSGVVSFKIEGRMRGTDYLKILIDAYGDSINRYIDDPLSFDRKKDSEKLFDNRQRDTSTAYAFGSPGLSFINSRYEGTGKFYSTGKVFSKATEESGITEKRTGEIKNYLASCAAANPGRLELGIKVNDMASAKAAVDKGVDYIYLSGETFLPGVSFCKKDIIDLAQKSKVYLSLPRVTLDIDMDGYCQLLTNELGIAGLVCANLGSIYKFKGKYPLVGDYPLNIYNNEAAKFFMDEGLQSFTVSAEAKLADLADVLSANGKTMQLIVQGSPTVMYLEHDLYKNLEGDYAGKIYLVDEAGFKHPVYKDRNGRNHLLLYKDLCLLPVLKELHGAGLCSIRIEAAHLDCNEITRLIDIYQRAVNDLDRCGELYNELGNNYSFGALEF